MMQPLDSGSFPEFEIAFERVMLFWDIEPIPGFACVQAFHSGVRIVAKHKETREVLAVISDNEASAIEELIEQLDAFRAKAA